MSKRQSKNTDSKEQKTIDENAARSRKELEEMFGRKWTSEQAAMIADTLVTNVRNWDARDRIDAVTFMGSGEPPKLDPRREQAERLKAKLEAAGEDAAWVDEAISNLPRDPRTYVTVEIFQIAALADLSRAGVTPSRGSHLVAKLTRDLAERAFGANGEPPTYWAPGLVIAEFRPENDGPAVQRLTPDELGPYLAAPHRRKMSSARIVIDTAALFERVLSRMNKVYREALAEEGR